MFTRIEPRKYSRQIIEQIRQRISSGSLAPGDRLPTELQLARLFGTSRSSIREALSALEILGLVENRGGRGKFIRGEQRADSVREDLLEELLRDASAFELFEARVELEPSLAALSAERATEEQKEALRLQLARLGETGKRAASRRMGRSAIIDEYLEEDRAFHLLIGESAHNVALYRLFVGVHSLIRKTHWKILRGKVSVDGEALRRIEGEHRAIYAAITRGRPEEARRRMNEHIKNLKNALL